MAKKTITETIEELSKLAMNLSLKVVEKMANNEEVEDDELKHLNGIKKHLNFAKKIHKEMNGGKADDKNMRILEEVKKKLLETRTSMGEIVRSIPKGEQL